MEGLDAGGDAGRESGCAAYQYFGSFVFHYFANGFFVSVEGEFVTMSADFLYRPKKDWSVRLRFVSAARAWKRVMMSGISFSAISVRFWSSE